MMPGTNHGIHRPRVFRAICSIFVSKRAIRSWKRSNRSRRSFVMSDLSESLMSLFKKERMSEERREWFALKHNKGKNCQKHRKNTNFLIDRFARITTESFTSLFLKSESLTVALKNERFWGKERISERVNSQPCLVLFSKTNSLSRTICLLLSGLCQL